MHGLAPPSFETGLNRQNNRVFAFAGRLSVMRLFAKRKKQKKVLQSGSGYLDCVKGNSFVRSSSIMVLPPA